MTQLPDLIYALYHDRTKVPNDVEMFLKSQFIEQKNNSLGSKVLLESLEDFARKTLHYNKCHDYALSGDNLIKMAFILLRAHANIPVIICGEAGCGKVKID